MSSQNIVILILVLVQITFCLESPLVHLSNGQILGREDVTFENTKYFSFQGIPYAAPPIGKLRFKPPQPAKNWDGILNTTFADAACYQNVEHIVRTETEDCLFLNVYTPKRSNNHLLPVMIFIHGGGFVYGTGYWYGPQFFIDHGVILVTINYRLGIFGFLSTGDHIVPGNNGLRDQQLAFKWVQNNIRNFGGDPGKVTIFGESSGATTVAYHLFNHKSRGLFQGVILQSGTVLSPWSLQRRSKEIAYSTAALLNSKINTSVSSQTLLEFLQSVNASSLNKAAEQYYDSTRNEWDSIAFKVGAWVPVIEVTHRDAFITTKMYDSLKNGHFFKVPIMIGFNSEESLFLNPDFNATKDKLKIIDKNLDLLVPDDMQISHLDNRKQMGQKIRKIYTGGEPFTPNHIGDGIRYTSDNMFTRSAIKHAELSSKFVKTYLYQFSYDGDIGNITTYYDGAEKVAHAEELFYLFCFSPKCNEGYSRSDLLARKRLITLWTNFAKYLNPTPQNDVSLQEVIWPEVCTDSGKFLYLDIGKNLVVRNKPKWSTYSKWSELYDSLGVNSFDTY